jgi:hypothetical protein
MKKERNGMRGIEKEERKKENSKGKNHNESKGNKRNEKE